MNTSTSIQPGRSAFFPDRVPTSRSASRTEQVVALREGRIHVGVYPDLCTPRGRQFQSQELFACPMVAELPPKYPHAGVKHEQGDLVIHTLAQNTVLIPALDYPPGYQERLKHTCKAADFTAPATHPVERVPNSLGTVTAGYRVTLLPEVLVRGQIADGQIHRLGTPVSPFRLNLIWLRQSTLQVLQNFLAVAQEVAGNVCSLLP